MVWRHVIHLGSLWSIVVSGKLFASVWLASPRLGFYLRVNSRLFVLLGLNVCPIVNRYYFVVMSR